MVDDFGKLNEETNNNQKCGHHSVIEICKLMLLNVARRIELIGITFGTMTIMNLMTSLLEKV